MVLCVAYIYANIRKKVKSAKFKVKSVQKIALEKDTMAIFGKIWWE